MHFRYATFIYVKYSMCYLLIIKFQQILDESTSWTRLMTDCVTQKKTETSPITYGLSIHFHKQNILFVGKMFPKTSQMFIFMHFSSIHSTKLYLFAVTYLVNHFELLSRKKMFQNPGVNDINCGLPKTSKYFYLKSYSNILSLSCILYRL